MLHKRSDKNSHLDTVLYEIDMLRHCSKTLAAKKAKASESDESQAEYNLVIEGFLIHLRNLLAFFTTLHSIPSDLLLDHPEVWYEKSLDEKEYSDLRDKIRAFNDNHSEMLNGGKKLDCHQLISKFLQHCTPERYEQAIGWDIEKMAAEMEPILADFEKRFPPATAPATLPVVWPGSATCSTSTMRIGAVAAVVENK